MKADEVDKIIAEALEKDRQQRSHRRRSGRSKKDTIQTVRKVLNIIFMIGFLAAIIVYFAIPENRILFFCLGFGAMLIKIVEFFLRFMF
jgi:hypothetical protein